MSEKINIHPHHFQIAFPVPFLKEDVIIFDSELHDGLITIIGYLEMGTSIVNLLVFPEPVDPILLKNSPFFQQTFKTGKKLALYNISHEIRLFDFDPAQCIELMPYPYCPKEKFIQIESLDKISSRHLPDWIPENFHHIIAHNFSCIAKMSVLYVFRDAFIKPETLSNLTAQVKNHFQNSKSQ